MEIDFTFSGFVHLAASLLGLLVAVILWWYPGKRSYPYRNLLGAFFGTLAIAVGFGFLIESRLILLVPHIYRLGNIFGLLFMPFSYLYLRSVVTHRAPGWPDLLHAAPALFYLIDFLPLFTSSVAEKTAAFTIAYQQHKLLAFSEGWLTPPYFHLKLRSLQFAVYWGLQVWLLLTLRRMKEHRVFYRENRDWLWFVTILLGFQFFIFFPILMVLYLGFPQYFWLASQVSGSLAVFVSALILFFRPRMLYGIHGLVQYSQREDEGTKDRSETSPSYLDEATVQALREKLNALMDEQRPYLDPDYSLGDLSSDLGIPAYRTTALLNKELGQNFNDFINRQRIKYCREKLEAGHWQNLSVQGMAQEAGFNHRNTFSKAFKKFTGKTPTGFLREQQGK